jgi:trimethylamine monooxygenase
MGFKWPDNVSERPLLVKVDGNMVHFKDRSTAEVDAIILCTGYLYSYPFLKDASLRLKTANVMYPDGLYKNTLWIKGGNKKLMYIAAQDQYYTYTLFDVQAKWCVNYIMGEITLPSQAAMEEDVKKWMCRYINKNILALILYPLGFILVGTCCYSKSLMPLTVELFYSSF